MYYNTNMDKVDVYCTDKDKTVSCDVLRKTDKHIRVILPGDLPLNLDRNDVSKPYVGVMYGLEFIVK